MKLHILPIFSFPLYFSKSYFILYAFDLKLVVASLFMRGFAKHGIIFEGFSDRHLLKRFIGIVI